MRTSVLMRPSSYLLLAALVVLLASCGVSGQQGGSSVNTSPPTSTSGPVIVATDHSAYSATEQIHVTVTNNLNVPIYALDTRASCSILKLQVLSGTTWRDASAAPCALGRVALSVRIAPNTSYTAVIAAGLLPHSHATFPNGSYRLVLDYSTSATASLNPTSIVSVDSATLTVTGSGAPPSGTIPSGTGGPPPVTPAATSH